MRSDRYTKIVVTIIAIGLWALVLTQQGNSISNVHASVPASHVAQEQRLPDLSHSPTGGGPVSRAATSTLPLRWRVRTAVLKDFSTVDCITIISVRNLAPTSTAVDVEWLDASDTSVGKSSTSIAMGHVKAFSIYNNSPATGGTNASPFSPMWADTNSDFTGSAQVHTDDPRISVAAFLRCDTQDADADPNSITSIPADPVGATMEYFQAGMAMQGEMPAMGVPDESR